MPHTPKFLSKFALLPLLVTALCGAVPLAAQTDANLQSGKRGVTANDAQGNPIGPKAPALVDAAGPTVSLEPSEALFDVAVALNACGFDAGLSASDPIRTQVREAFEQEAAASPDVQTARDQVCTFVNQHQLLEASQELSQYVSLALYMTPPPALELSVDQQELPPDALPVSDIVPLLQKLAKAADLHLLYLRFRPEYEAEVNALHDPLTRMVINTNVYLKLPLSTYTNRRFFVILEPLLDPAQTNARVYGPNYLVVAAPVKGKIDMQDVRHAYLHYEIEPLLYSRASSLDRFQPFLKVVHDAPIDYEYRSDIASLVTECMVRAVEARTMDTGVTIMNIPPNAPRADLPHLTHELEVSQQKDAAVREAKVQQDMTEGFVLTQYFYNALRQFEKNPESLAEAMGPMVYGMDVEQVVGQVRHIQFVAQEKSDVIRSPITNRNLDLAEDKLRAGDADAANKLAMQALKEHTADQARADYILALTWLMKGDMDSATNDLEEAVRLTRDPRLLAWSHIFLGRIDDVKQDRSAALTEYQAAAKVPESQPDTIAAADQGLKQPYTLQHAPGGSGSTQDAQPQP